MSALIAAMGVGTAAIAQMVLMVMVLGLKASVTWIGVVHLVMFLIALVLLGLRIAQICAGGEGSFYKNNVKCIRIATIVLGSVLALLMGIIFALTIHQVIKILNLNKTHNMGISMTGSYILVVVGAFALIGHLVNTSVACCNADNGDQA